MGRANHLSKALVSFTLLASPPAMAFGSGQGSEPGAVEFLTIEEAASFSKQIEDQLAAQGARVALVFRSGRTRDRLPDNVAYTHGAFWVYQPIERADETVMNGYAVYNLYHGDGESMPRTQSYLAQDFPFDFAETSAVNDVGVIIPHPELQRRIFEVMASPTYEALHIDSYSLISNVSDPEFQNCNEFMLDVIAAAAWQTSDYAQIKANLDAHFVPTRLRVNFFERLFAPVSDERIRTSDHSGQIATATFASIASFLEQYDMLQDSYVLTRNESLVF